MAAHSAIAADVPQFVCVSLQDVVPARQSYLSQVAACNQRAAKIARDCCFFRLGWETPSARAR